jgi:hypothetical protein
MCYNNEVMLPVLVTDGHREIVDSVLLLAFCSSFYTFFGTMTQIRLSSIVVLLLLGHSIEVCDGALRKNRKGRMKAANATKTAETTQPPLTEMVTPVGGAPIGVIPLGGGGPLKPNAPAYAGFFCGPPEKGEQGIMEKCNSLPVCKFKRVDDGSMGKIITSELEEGQGDCMRRCDTRFGLSEGHCGMGEKCHSFIMGCPCPNLGDEGCRPYKD